MKIGLILECQDGGAPDRMNADELVGRHVIKIIAPGTEVEPVFLNRKPRLIDECGVYAKQLLANKCCCVIIIWDLYPLWGGKVCMKRDRDAVLKNLKDAGIPDDAPVYLLCISYELETWFIVDRQVLIDALPKVKADKIKRVRNFERTDPKTILSNYFRSPYRGTTKQVRQLLKGLKKERFRKIQRKCTSFDRFVKQIETCKSL
jgi:hypothetical protein